MIFESGVHQKPPKHAYYRRRDSGVVRPAADFPSGFEDNDPNMWLPSTKEEYDAQNGIIDGSVTQKTVLPAPAPRVKMLPKG